MPFVPVTPTTVISDAGSPKRLRDISASASRLSSTMKYGIAHSGASSHTTHSAPRSAAEAMYLWPSVSNPLIATNTVPGAALRES